MQVIKAQPGDSPCFSCGKKASVKLMFFRGIWEVGPTFCNRCKKLSIEKLSSPPKEDIPRPRTSRKEFDKLMADMDKIYSRSNSL